MCTSVSNAISDLWVDSANAMCFISVPQLNEGQLIDETHNEPICLANTSSDCALFGTVLSFMQELFIFYIGGITWV